MAGPRPGWWIVQVPSFSSDSHGNGEMSANALPKFCQTHERSDMSCHDNVLLKSIDLLTRMTRKNSLLTGFINLFLSVNCVGTVQCIQCVKCNVFSMYTVYSEIFVVCIVCTVCTVCTMYTCVLSRHSQKFELDEL